MRAQECFPSPSHITVPQTLVSYFGQFNVRDRKCQSRQQEDISGRRGRKEGRKEAARRGRGGKSSHRKLAIKLLKWKSYGDGGGGRGTRTSRSRGAIFIWRQEEGAIQGRLRRRQQSRRSKQENALSTVVAGQQQGFSLPERPQFTQKERRKRFHS